MTAADDTGDVLYIVLDKLAMHLAYQESSKGTLLLKTSVVSYFGNVKNRLVELFPALSSVSGRRLQKIASTLDKYCAKMGADFTKQAPPWSKADLHALVTVIYCAATTPDDYKDASFLILLCSPSSANDAAVDVEASNVVPPPRRIAVPGQCRLVGTWQLVTYHSGRPSSAQGETWSTRQEYPSCADLRRSSEIKTELIQQQLHVIDTLSNQVKAEPPMPVEGTRAARAEVAVEAARPGRTKQQRAHAKSLSSI
ncbi:hypothetical protein ON010_g194 [Phytophthora cinnamomi]|nr:hypothetical protein ON010_g194 [Phytophthora cinnamomi]